MEQRVLSYAEKVELSDIVFNQGIVSPGQGPGSIIGTETTCVWPRKPDRMIEKRKLFLQLIFPGKRYQKKTGFLEPEQVFAALLAYARGEQPTGPVETDLPLPDPRRGSAT